LNLKLRLTAILALAAVSAGPAFAQAGGGSVLIKGARIFDGEKSISPRDVLVIDGRIARVARAIRAQKSIVTVDGRGSTLLPGLMDAHVHVFPTAAADALRFGVTTEFDMFTLSDLQPLPLGGRNAQAIVKPERPMSGARGGA
jgi:hypothetical protein